MGGKNKVSLYKFSSQAQLKVTQIKNRYNMVMMVPYNDVGATYQ